MIRAQFYTTVSFENLFFQPQVFQSNAYTVTSYQQNKKELLPL